MKVLPLLFETRKGQARATYCLDAGNRIVLCKDSIDGGNHSIPYAYGFYDYFYDQENSLPWEYSLESLEASIRKYSTCHSNLKESLEVAYPKLKLKKYLSLYSPESSIDESVALDSINEAIAFYNDESITSQQRAILEEELKIYGVYKIPTTIVKPDEKFHKVTGKALSFNKLRTIKDGWYMDGKVLVKSVVEGIE